VSAHVPVTAEELAEIARLDAEATPGPWTTDGGQVVETEHQIDPEADPGERSDVCECLNYGRDPGPFRTGTARFIAASRDLMPRLAHDLAERTAERDAEIERRERNEGALIVERDEAIEERDALAATVERLIREAGAIRLDERQRAEAEHRALADEGRQRDANRIERLEEQVARMRAIVDDADRAKAEHEKTRDELRRLHDVLSGAKKL